MIAPDIEGYVIDGVLVLYSESRVLANMILAEQESEHVLWTDLGAWDEQANAWQVIAQSGDPSTALETWTLINKDDGDSLDKPQAMSWFGQATLGPGGVALLALVAGAVVFGVAYLGLAAPGSSIAGDSHRLSESLAAAIVIALAAAVMGDQIRRRH